MGTFGALFDTHRFDEVLYDQKPESAPFTTRHERHGYFLEVHDGSSGDLLYMLPYYRNAPWERTVNQAATLDFTYPEGQDQAASLVETNQVWLRDSAMNLLEKFHIRKYRQIHGGGQMLREVGCESLLGQLADEYMIGGYEATTADNKTINDIIEEWLASSGTQTNALPIRIGSIAPAIGDLQREILVKRTRTILEAIRDLLDTVNRNTSPWFMYVDPATRRFYIKTSIGEDKGQEIRVKKNMKSIRRTVDKEQLVTRLFLFGKNVDITDAGAGNEYVDATTIGTYGVKTFVREENKIQDANQLLDLANAIIARDDVRHPRVTYEISAIDLSKTTQAVIDAVDFTFEALDLGSTIRVIDEDLSVNLETVVRRIRVDIGHPLTHALQLENDTRDITDIISELVRRVDETGAGNIISTATPQGISTDGTGSAGGLGEVSDSGHIHGYTTAAAEALVTEGIGTSSAITFSDATPEEIATAGSAGSGETIPRPTHVHKGQPFITAADVAALATAMTVDGTLGYTTGATKLAYVRLDGTLTCITFFVAADAAALASIMTVDGTTGYTTGATKRAYVRVDGSLISFSHAVA